MASVGTVVIEVDANIAKLVEGMKKSENQINMLQKKATEMQNTFTKFAKIAASLYIVKEAFEGAIGIVSKFVDTKAQFEQYETVLRTLEGSSIKAKESMRWIQDFAAKTPYEIGEVTNAFVKMKAYGMNPTNGSLKTLGDTAAAMGKNISDAVEMMADAVTGENERLKEFGVKASILGDKIKYTWADSSGETKKIIVANNRDVIESTLEAIFNSKYAGAMDAQSSTWNGIMSNMADKWTNFQIEVMDGGLFDYIKAGALTISDYLGSAFENGANGAKSFSIMAIEGIKSIILAVGNMYDMWNGIRLVWTFLKTTFYGLVAGLIGGINYLAKAWDWAGVNIQNIFKFIVENIGTMWNKLINFMIDGLNRLASGAIFGGLGQAFELIGQKNPFKIINIELGKFDSGIKTAKMSTKDFIDNGFTRLYQNSLSEEQSLLSAVANEDGKKKEEKFLSDLEKNLAKLNSLSTQDKQGYKKYLEDLIKQAAAAGDAAEKAGGKGKKGHDAAAQAAREQEKILKELQEAYSTYTDIVGTSWDKFQEKLTKTMQELKNLPVDMRFEVREKMTGEYKDTWMSKYYDEIGDKIESLKIKQKQVLEDLKGANLPGIDIGKVEASQYEEMIKTMESANKSVADDLKNKLSSALSSLARGDFQGAFEGILDNLTNDSMDKLSEGLLSMFGGVGGSNSSSSATATSGGSSGSGIGGAISSMGWMGMAASVIGSALSTSVTEAELRAATGRTDFTDKSIQNLGAMFGNVQYPLLEATNTMSKHIRNMDNNFQAVARAITGNASASGIDLTGANFVPTDEIGFIGLWSKNISLVSTGLQFEMQKLKDMMDKDSLQLRGYTTTLVKTSAIWGLIHREKLKNAYKDLPDNIMNDMADAFASGYQSILTAGVTLGFNEKKVTQALDAARLNMGRIDFTGLTPSEVSARLTMAVSEAFSGVINGIDIFTGLVDRYATASEYSLETLVRIATEYDQAVHQFNLIDKKFVNGLYTRQMQVLDIVESTGGMDNFNDAMSTFMGNFYTDAEQLGFMTESMSVAFNTLHVSMPKTKSEFRNLLETMDTSTEAGSYLYGQILLLSDSFNEMSTASENLKTSMSDSLQSILDAFTGELSYLTLSQKAEYASRYYKLAGQSNSLIDSVEAARVQAETAIKTASTREEYIPIFDKYVKELEKQAKDATNTDLLNALKAIKDEIIISRNEQTKTLIYTKASA